jgi:DNA-binding transcriptional MerR regulator
MKTTTLTLPLDHLYYLTSDPNNDTGYTIEQVQAMIDEKGGAFEIEATITHPTPPPYSVEWDIEQHQARIDNNQEILAQLQTHLATLEEGTGNYLTVQQQIESIESDIVMCQEHIASLS